MGTNHIVIGGVQHIVEHFLVENGGAGARQGRDNPDPVSWAATAKSLLVFQVLHETLTRRVVIDNCCIAQLK